MKVKFLKKIRKRYSWRYDRSDDLRPGRLARWVLMDHSDMIVNRYTTSYDLLEEIVLRDIGFASYCHRFQIRINRMERLKYYRECKLAGK